MRHVHELAEMPAIQSALQQIRSSSELLIELAISIQQIPAPTFAEDKRADFVESYFKQLRLTDVSQDELHNVFARIAGKRSDQCVVVSAHLDTVFPAETDLAVRREGNFLHGAGIGDNSVGVAGLLQLAQVIREYDLQPDYDIWFVANVCEEGLGDLKGMRAVVERFGNMAHYVVIEGGLFGEIFHSAIGANRFRVTVETPGGHSWGNFGVPSAVHVLGKIIAGISQLPVSQNPKTTYNVGVIEGGTSVNTIASSASFLLDLRSEDAQDLQKITQRVFAIIRKATSHPQVSATVEQVGQRPSGSIPRTENIVMLAKQALEWVKCRQIRYSTGSTDANIPLSLGYPTVCIGLSTCANAHRLDEYLDTTHLPQGMSQLLLLVMALTGQDDIVTR